MKRQHFIYDGARWFIDVPEYLEQGGSKDDLDLVSGAGILLAMIAGQNNELTLDLDTVPFDNADELILTDLGDPLLGMGYYHMHQFENKEVNKDLCLCDVTRFVFGDIPEKIYVKRVTLS